MSQTPPVADARRSREKNIMTVFWGWLDTGKQEDTEIDLEKPPSESGYPFRMKAPERSSILKTKKRKRDTVSVLSNGSSSSECATEGDQSSHKGRVTAAGWRSSRLRGPRAGIKGS